MTVRLPRPASAARILRETLQKNGIILGQSQALEVIAKLYGHNSWYALQYAEKHKPKETAQEKNTLQRLQDVEGLKNSVQLETPDPALPFFGCELPRVITAIDQVFPDNHIARFPAKQLSDGCLNWLETGMLDDSYDTSEDFLFCASPLKAISIQEILSAQLTKEGLFTLPNGISFYLIDQDSKRWLPKKRV